MDNDHLSIPDPNASLGSRLSSSPTEQYTSLKKSLSRMSEHHLPPPPNAGEHAQSPTWRTHKKNLSAESMHIDIPKLPMASEIALAALQYLPTPLLVLSSLKTIVMANEAMGRLLGLGQQISEDDDAPETVLEILKGQTLSQIGIDMISDGSPVWVDWGKFLDRLAHGVVSDDDEPTKDKLEQIRSGETTPVPGQNGLDHELPRKQPHSRGRSPFRDKTVVHDTVVDVVVSSHAHDHGHRHKPRSPGIQATCRMIISIWTLEDQRFFTLTFTSPSTQAGPHNHSSHSHIVSRTKSTPSSKSARSSRSHTPTSSTSSSAVHTPYEATTPTSSISSLPAGAPSKCQLPQAFTEFQKVTRMKDAMLKKMHIPVVAIWKDESAVFPNDAARRLLSVNSDPTSDESYDFMSRFKPWAVDFSHPLEDSDNPILSLCRTQKPFTKWQIGLINERTGKKSTYEVVGHPVYDEKTNEMFAGLVAFKDVTEWTEKIASQTTENEEQFQLICDMMPQMLWTTRPDGYHDYFSQRWYDYTGLTPQNSLGMGWQLPFHPDDMPETSKRWAHSLATGETYNTEYRCRRHDGVWRWMLGRAMPLRDSKTGEILKWFGTCTDVQDIVDMREAASAMRSQLLDILHHCQMNIWVIDKEGTLQFFEGALFGMDDAEKAEARKKEIQSAVGGSIFDALKMQGDEEWLKKVADATKRVLHNESNMELMEMYMKDRWYRWKIVPYAGNLRTKPSGRPDGTREVDGVIGITTDATQMKEMERENVQLLANESAAKEASKMKSAFLANMSHEIRTPIAGVLGMSELLMDTNLDSEQNEFAANIQRSANSLLTVINDILDFSKIESGRLDIEEVQFSLGVVLKDVAKMLSYAAQRKNLRFSSDLQLGETGELILLGDPGRIRQILTNLLTNSIKFTQDGHVKLEVRLLSTTSEITTVQFSVSDSGIGIEEEVKQRLFKPFSQADSSTARRYGGTGLGLTICKNLVDLMKGTISLDSRLGQGTTATFTIPFRKPEFVAQSTPLVEVSAFPDRLQSELSISVGTTSTADGKTPKRVSPPPMQSPQSVASMRVNRASLPPGPSKEPSPEPEISRENVHVLVVEDNPVNQQIALKFIRGLNFSVSAVWNGKEALEYLLRATSKERTEEEAKQCPIPDLILMDCQMPILDGYNATHLLRHHAPYNTVEAIKRIPIVAMTASAIQGDREKCEKAGMDDYLAKPVKRPILEKMILKWIKREKDIHSLRMTSVSPAPPEEMELESKPNLVRSSTEHSSNCPEHDYIAADWMAAHQPSFRTPESTRTISTSTTQQHRRQSSEQIRRSSLSRSLLATNMSGGGDTEDARSRRREEAEDKARILRDAKLLSATDDDHGLSPPAALVAEAESAFGFGNHVSSNVQTSYPGQGASENAAGVMALTEENVQRFNSVLETPTDGDAASFGALSPTSEDPPPPRLSPALIPGGPPEMMMPMPTTGGAGGFTTTSHHQHLPIRHIEDTGLKVPTTAWAKEKARAQVGALKHGERSKSDWSTSTAKPNHGRPVMGGKRRSSGEA